MNHSRFYGLDVEQSLSVYKQTHIKRFVVFLIATLVLALFNVLFIHHFLVMMMCVIIAGLAYAGIYQKGERELSDLIDIDNDPVKARAMCERLLQEDVTETQTYYYTLIMARADELTGETDLLYHDLRSLDEPRWHFDHQKEQLRLWGHFYQITGGHEGFANVQKEYRKVADKVKANAAKTARLQDVASSWDLEIAIHRHDWRRARTIADDQSFKARTPLEHVLSAWNLARVDEGEGHLTAAINNYRTVAEEGGTLAIRAQAQAKCDALSAPQYTDDTIANATGTYGLSYENDMVFSNVVAEDVPMPANVRDEGTQAEFAVAPEAETEDIPADAETPGYDESVDAGEEPADASEHADDAPALDAAEDDGQEDAMEPSTDDVVPEEPRTDEAEDVPAEETPSVAENTYEESLDIVESEEQTPEESSVENETPETQEDPQVDKTVEEVVSDVVEVAQDEASDSEASESADDFSVTQEFPFLAFGNPEPKDEDAKTTQGYNFVSEEDWDNLKPKDDE